MQNAFEYTMGKLREGMDEVNSWVAAHVEGCTNILAEVQGTVRGIIYLAVKQVSYLDVIPYLLGRLNEPGVRDRAMQQYRSAPARLHHRESVRMLGEESEYTEDIRNIGPDGSNISERLWREIEGILNMPFNDGTMEEPHNLANRVHQDAPASTWEWVASSVRLPQNLTDVRELVLKLGLNLQKEWRDRKKCSSQKAVSRGLGHQSGAKTNHSIGGCTAWGNFASMTWETVAMTVMVVKTVTMVMVITREM